MATRSLVGSRALVTGASSGIGRALAVELVRCGADLLVTARRSSELTQLAAEIENQGKRCDVLAGDITSPELREQLVRRAQERLQGLDILVNNAGASAHGRFANSSSERLRTILEVNFFSAVELTRAALPLLRASQAGVVVNVASILGHRGIPHNSDYCASKFALRGWSEAVRSELAQLGIGVLVVSPGPTDTEFFEHLLEKEEELPWARNRRGVSPQAVARATVWAIRRGKREIVPSLSGRLMLGFNRFCPGLLDRILARYG